MVLPSPTCANDWGPLSMTGSCESTYENSQPSQEQLASNGARQGPISYPPLPSSCEQKITEPSAAALQRMAGWCISALAGPSYWHGAGVWLIHHHHNLFSPRVSSTGSCGCLRNRHGVGGFTTKFTQARTRTGIWGLGCLNQARAAGPCARPMHTAFAKAK